MKYLLPIIIILILGVGLYSFTSNSSKSDMDKSSDSGSQMKMETDKNMDGTPVREVISVLISQNDSGQSGVATLREKDGKLTVDIKMEGSVSKQEQPAHVHLGSCANIAGVKHPLSNVVNGMSSTTIDTTFDDLKKNLPLSINVHKSAAESSVYVACGNLFTE